MLTSFSENYERRDNLRKVHKGIVVDSDDPLKIGRVRCFVKGVFEGVNDNLPWCSPVYPAGLGSSPDSVQLIVPEPGSEVQVMFFGENLYSPAYNGKWLSQNLSPQEILGKDYPNSYGSIDSTGSWNRIDKTTMESETYHSSGYAVRILGNGDVETSVPNDFILKVDGSFKVLEKFWQSGGSGFSGLVESLLFSVLEGPYLSGVFDLAAFLPVTTQEFQDDLYDLHQFGIGVQGLDPPMLGLVDLESLVRNPDRIVLEFTALGGAEGVCSLILNMFSGFGTDVSAQLRPVASTIDEMVNSFDSITDMKNLLSEGKTPQLLSKKVAADIVQGTTALSKVSGIIKTLDEVKKLMDSWDREWNPRALLSSLPKVTKEGIVSYVKIALDKLLDGCDKIDIQSRVLYLLQMDLEQYLIEEAELGISIQEADPKAVTEDPIQAILDVTEGLLDLGVIPYYLGMSGDVVGSALLLRDSSRKRYDLLELVGGLMSRGVYADYVMQFCRDLSITADMTPKLILKRVDDLIDAGVLSSSDVSYAGKVVWYLTKKGYSQRIVDFTRSLVDWFKNSGYLLGTVRVQSEMMMRDFSTFYPSLDVTELQGIGMKWEDVVEAFNSLFISRNARGFIAYGSVINKIFTCGMFPQIQENLSKLLSDIDKRSSSESVTLFPPQMKYSLVMGTPMESSRSDQIQYQIRDMRSSSRRVVRAGKRFKDYNLDYVKNVLQP